MPPADDRDRPADADGTRPPAAAHTTGLDVGDDGATLAGDGLAMAMLPLSHHHEHQHQHQHQHQHDGSHRPHPSPSPPSAPSSAAAAASTPAASEEPASTPSAAGKGGWFPNLCLVLTMVTFAANNSALIWVLGVTKSTTCNVLCSAQTVGIVSFIPLFYKDLAWAKVRALRRRDWAAIVTASLSRNVVGAYFDVEGMRLTSVPTLAIAEMLEPVEFLLLATCLLPEERRNRWILGNMGLLVVGVLAGLLLQPTLNGGPLPSARGVGFLVLGGAGYTFAEVLGHVYLEHVPLGVYATARVVLGVVFYHLLSFLEGDGTDRYIGISNLYTARLWKHMVWYGLLFVTVGQALWLTALTRCRPQAIALGTSSLFVINLAFSAIILGVAPTGAEYVGAAIIIVSIVSSLLEARHHERREKEEMEKGQGGAADEEELGGALPPLPPRLQTRLTQEGSITGSRV